MLDLNDEATVGPNFKKLSGGQRTNTSLQHAFSTVNLLLQTHPPVFFMSRDIDIQRLIAFLAGHPNL